MRLSRHLREQKKRWKNYYTNRYFYQGLECIGIKGVKPTEYRFTQYDVDDLLKGRTVADIGSNSGFVAIYVAKFARHVVGIELNPYLNQVAIDTARSLNIKNLNIIESDIAQYYSSTKFDAILSLSNHHTIDGNLNLTFQSYIEKIFEFLEPNGYLLFESHNVFGPGSGGVGDDGDMEDKLIILSRHFVIERYRMIHKSMRFSDVDKLFIVARKSDAPTSLSFKLVEAKEKYNWTFN